LNSLPVQVTAVFNWFNGPGTEAQSFKFWFRGFPDTFNTLQDLQPGNFYFFQVTGATSINVPNPNTYTVPPPGGSFITVAGANGRVWNGNDIAKPAMGGTIPPGLPTGVTAVFRWKNSAQLFEFWFRGFPDSFNTLNAGVVRGGYYFFQAGEGIVVPTN